MAPVNQVGTRDTRDRKWTRPPDGRVKFNMDATCVIRNSEGQFIAARCR